MANWILCSEGLYGFYHTQRSILAAKNWDAKGRNLSAPLFSNDKPGMKQQGITCPLVPTCLESKEMSPLLLGCVMASVPARSFQIFLRNDLYSDSGQANGTKTGLCCGKGRLASPNTKRTLQWRRSPLIGDSHQEGGRVQWQRFFCVHWDLHRKGRKEWPRPWGLSTSALLICCTPY